MREGLISSAPARFDLGDLGLLDGTTEPEFDIITRNVCLILQGSASLFCLLDGQHSAVFVRSRYIPRGSSLLPERYALHHSMFARIIEGNKGVKIIDLADASDFGNAFEPSVLPFKSVLTQPVYGPAMEPIGCLAVLSNVPRKWAVLEQMELRDQAHLLSRYVLLRASLETLKRLSRERDALSQAHRYQN